MHRIILFRGMNTGGVRAPVAEQRVMAAAMGLKNPRTLAASGNLVVESDKATDALEHDVEAAMEKTFGLKVAAMVRTPDQWAKLVAAGKVSKPRLETLAAVVRDVLNEAILAGGSTLKDFANADGGQGYFQHRFDVYRSEERRVGKECW